MSDRVGQQFGQYRLLRLLGQGAFAEVYLGEHVYLGTSAAVKVLHTLVNAEDVGKFLQEARMLANLKHPHIVRVLDFGVDGRTPYLVMEYAPGGTLRSRYPKGTHLPLSTVVDYVKQVAQALEYAHSRKVIHRDIKPENILIGENGELLLSDFGIALITRSTRSQSVADMAGTINYMAPEQINAHPYPASDQYSLAVVVYEWLSGNCPFDGSFMEIAIKHSVAPPPPLRGILPTLSPEVDQVILTALAKTPEERFATVSAFATALEEASVELPTERLHPVNSASLPHPPQPMPKLRNTATAVGVSTSPVSPIPPVSPSRPRTRRAFLIGGSAVAGIAIVGGTALFLANSNKKATGGTGPVPGGTLTLNFSYSVEKQVWMEEVIGDFNKSNTRVGSQLIQIQGDPRSSVNAKSRILSGELKPAAWSPASDLELNQLINAWKKQHGSQDIVYTGGDMGMQSLVLTPLVFAAWKDRSDLLKAKYGNIDWPGVHDALQLPSWSRIPGGQASWGPVKFGQTRPDSSNSGLLSITLLAYSYYKISRGLSVEQMQSPDFLKYFAEVEDNVQKFGLSSATYLQNEVIVQGPSAYDIVATNENLVLTLQKAAQQRWSQPLVPSYPGLNIMSNHPFAIFTNAAQDEQTAARKFRDFLLDVPQQRKALLSGFRPTNPHVSLHDSISGNPFTDTTLGFQVPDQLTTQVQAPGGDVTDELLNQWLAKYGTAPTA